ncbi:MAG: addiction module toxin, HicA family [Candidatus Heimdallarchaeota archaeon]|nr:MAG: addiction module toxin, HicA family [Candidatus Heimdallarchaeota archaeon]
MKLKPLTARKVIKVLMKIGFTVVRRKGSHVILKHEDGRLIVVPDHKGEQLGKGLLIKIINDSKLSREEFYKLVDK